MAQAQSVPHPHFQALFEEICDSLSAQFYDPTIIQQEFPSIKTAYRKNLANIKSYTDFSPLINDMLDELNVSHTHYYTPLDQAYYYLSGIFEKSPLVNPFWREEKVQCYSPGYWTKKIEGKNFVYAIIDGGAAEKAGILVGDEIIEPTFFPYAKASFLPKGMDTSLVNEVSSTFNTKERIKDSVIVEFRRNADGPVLTAHLPLNPIHPNAEMLDALTSSVNIEQIGQKKIGYVHIWSYAGTSYQDAFVDIISQDSFSQVDALVWDLRDGWGGASPEYLNVFNPHIPTLISFSAKADTFIYTRQWKKPVVMLVNKGTRSGKEILAYGFKKHQMGPIVGETTAGAVVAGQLSVLSDGGLMYIASRDVLVDGIRLEGVGVKADIPVVQDIRYAEGKDRQLEKAFEVAAGLVR